jgi:hypothetical protein
MPKLLGSSLHPRDMRRLVTPFSASNEPELIVRRHVMVFNFDPLRAIITRDRLLVLVPNGADSVLKNLEERIVGSGLEFDGYNEETNSDERDEDDSAIFDMSLKLNDLEKGMPESVKEADENKDENGVDDHNDNNDDNEDDEGDDWSEMMMMEMEGNREELTFELLCVNACLSTVFEMLADDTRELQDKGLKCVQERVIGNGSGRRPHKKQLRPEDALAVIRNLKNAVKVMQARVKGFVHSINRILNEDEDMALMNLSRLITHPENFVQPVSQEMLEVESDEPELVLESNLHNALTLSNALDLIQGQVETARHVCDSIRCDSQFCANQSVRGRFLIFSSFLFSIPTFSSQTTFQSPQRSDRCENGRRPKQIPARDSAHVHCLSKPDSPDLRRRHLWDELAQPHGKRTPRIFPGYLREPCGVGTPGSRHLCRVCPDRRHYGHWTRRSGRHRFAILTKQKRSAVLLWIGYLW